MKQYPGIKYKLHALKPELKKRFGVDKIGFFDCYIDRHHHHDCELNILVELAEPLGWDFFSLKEFLERKLRIRVDICTPRALKPALKEEILQSTIFV